MNRSQSSFVLLLTLFTWLGAATSQALPWVERHGMSGATWQTEFNLWTSPPYSYRGTRVCGSETSGQARYTSILEKSGKTTAWAVHHGLDGPSFMTTHDSLHAAGFRLVWLDGFGVGIAALYNGIWEKNGGAAQRVSLEQSLSSHLPRSATAEVIRPARAPLARGCVRAGFLGKGINRQGDPWAGHQGGPLPTRQG